MKIVLRTTIMDERVSKIIQNCVTSFMDKKMGKDKFMGKKDYNETKKVKDASE